MENKTETEFVFPLRVYIEDTDAGGIVYHANYLNYFERARSEWAEAQGFGIEWQKEQGILFPVRYVRVDYLRPALLNELLEVVSHITKLHYASIVYDQYLRSRQRPDILLCRAEVKIACVDSIQLRPRALPDIFYGEPV